MAVVLVILVLIIAIPVTVCNYKRNPKEERPGLGLGRTGRRIGGGRNTKETQFVPNFVGKLL